MFLNKRNKHNDVLRFIELYRSHEVLWNIIIPEYRRNDLKLKAYEAITAATNMPVEVVRKKIKSLRTAYSAEKVKVEASKKSGCDPVYTPSVFWYDEMKFLDALQVCRKTADNSNKVTEPEQKQPEQKQKPPEPPVAKKKKPNPTIELVKQATASCLATPPDTCQQMANVWGQKLSKMERMQRIIAERVINEVMFNAELGLLNTNTGLTNIGTVYHIQSSPSFTEPKEEIVTIENNDIFGI